MSEGFTFQVEDVIDLTDVITRAETVVHRRLKTEGRQLGRDIVKTARELVPVDTGATRDSIEAEVHVEGVSLKVVAGPSTSYAGFLEFGTSRMAPRPYMGPAIDRHVTPALERIIDRLARYMADWR